MESPAETKTPMKLWLKHLFWPMLLLSTLTLTSCHTENLLIHNVNYQSVRTSFAQPKEIPADAKIAVQYYINQNGEIMVIVYNRTNEIMTIDQTKSFFVNTNGQSVSYYDPKVTTTITGNYSSDTRGASFNLGALANAFGIGGVTGKLMSGTTVGGSNTLGTHKTSTVTVQDQPKVSVGPHGSMIMSKQYCVAGLGKNPLPNRFVDLKPSLSPLKFSVCISYSIDGTDIADKIVTDFYVNSNIYTQAKKEEISNAFKDIYNSKPDALAEPLYMFLINTNLPSKSNQFIRIDKFESIDIGGVYDTYVHGTLIDYK